MQTIIFPPELETELEHKKPVSEPRLIFPAFNFENLEEFRPLPVSLN